MAMVSYAPDLLRKKLSVASPRKELVLSAQKIQPASGCPSFTKTPNRQDRSCLSTIRLYQVQVAVQSWPGMAGPLGLDYPSLLIRTPALATSGGARGPSIQSCMASHSLQLASAVWISFSVTFISGLRNGIVSSSPMS